jgi:hypothetical protein
MRLCSECFSTTAAPARGSAVCAHPQQHLSLPLWKWQHVCSALDSRKICHPVEDLVALALENCSLNRWFWTGWQATAPHHLKPHVAWCSLLHVQPSHGPGCQAKAPPWVNLPRLP